MFENNVMNLPTNNISDGIVKPNFPRINLAKTGLNCCLTWERIRRTVTAPHQECIVTRWLEVRESRSQAARSPTTRQGRERRGKMTWKMVEQQGRQQEEHVNISMPWPVQ